MAKRKLTRRQSWRIKKIQQERTARSSKKDVQLEQKLEAGQLGEEQQGLVISHFGSQLDIESDTGMIHRCHLRSNLENLVTGDRVVWCAGEPTGVVVALQERRSLLSRPDAHANLRPVASNIDYIVLVIAPEPTPYANLIDRYLVTAELVGIEPIILLNKVDLKNNYPELALDELLATYQHLGYQVLTASTRSRDGLDNIKQVLNQHTSVFVGQSGVGKSSLINVLLPGVDIRVGELSSAHNKGRHTTTTARLFHFPEGGDLIDSPGIREFGLWHMSPAELARGFVEFQPFLGQCRFRNCQHLEEPDCALTIAQQQGKISATRLDSFRRILISLKQD
jgi:ribosome biogenesis GTPase